MFCMTSFLKDVLAAGRYFPPKVGKHIEFTGADLRDLAARGNEMLRAGWGVPVYFEHGKGRVPFPLSMSKAEQQARGMAGEAKAFRTRGNKLEVVVGIDDGDAGQVETVGYVSPEIDFDIRTGDGRIWEGPSITHIAVTPTPVNTNQNRFRRIDKPIALSRYGSAIRLSLGDLMNDDDADDLDETPDAENPGDGQEDEPENPAPAAPGNKSTEKAAVDGDLASALEQIGLFIPADAMGSIAAFKNALLISAKTLLAAKAEMPGDDSPADDMPPDETPLDGKPPAAAAPSEGVPSLPMGDGSNPIGMSRAKVDALEKAHSKIVAGHRQKYASRVSRLFNSGRVTPAVRDRIAKRIPAIKLSLNDNLEPEPNELDELIATFEDLPPGAIPGAGKSRGITGPVDLSRAKPVRPPSPGNPSQAQSEAVLEDWARTTGTLDS
jgi:hypothetical protein